MMGMLFFISRSETYEPTKRTNRKVAESGGDPLKQKCSAVLAAITIAIMFLTGCSTSNSNNASADWAFSFVVWNDYLYQIDDEYVMEVEEEIGEVTVYSDMEGTYAGNFSNEYVEGTKYYSIQGISTEEAIAVQEDGKYRKAVRNGKYEWND